MNPARLLIDDVKALPVVLTTAEAASLLGVSVDHLWALARQGDAPVEPLRLGRVYRWPTARLLALAGLDPASALTRNEAPNSPVEASSIPLAAPNRQVRRRDE